MFNLTVLSEDLMYIFILCIIGLFIGLFIWLLFSSVPKDFKEHAENIRQIFKKS